MHSNKILLYLGMVLEMMSTVRHMMGADNSCGSMLAVSARVSCPGGRRGTSWGAS